MVLCSCVSEELSMTAYILSLFIRHYSSFVNVDFQSKNTTYILECSL